MPNQDLFPTWLQILLGIFIAAILLAIIFAIFKDAIIALFSKTISTHATLVSKAEQDFVTQKAYAGGGSPQGNINVGVAEKGKVYSSTFQLDNNKFVTLLVSKDFYDVALEGGDGTLTYKGKRFISYDGITEGTKVRTDNNPNSFVGINKTL